MAEIPIEQWNMPVSFSSDESRMVTLREYLNPLISSVPIAELTLQQRIAIAVKRIEALPACETGTINAGLIGKDRAITEIQAKTNLGQNLLEIEQITIGFVLEAARRK
jgi:hypothetical protein